MLGKYALIALFSLQTASPSFHVKSYEPVRRFFEEKPVKTERCVADINKYTESESKLDKSKFESLKENHWTDDNRVVYETRHFSDGRRISGIAISDTVPDSDLEKSGMRWWHWGLAAWDYEADGEFDEAYRSGDAGLSRYLDLSNRFFGPELTKNLQKWKGEISKRQRVPLEAIYIPAEDQMNSEKKRFADLRDVALEICSRK